MRQAIVAVIVDRGDVLVVERAAADTYPGYWSAITGSMEPGESQIQACIREAAEEAGLHVRPQRKVWESTTRRAHFVLHWWLCELAGPRDVTPDPAEVSEARWVPLADAAAMPLMFSDARFFLREVLPATA